MCSLKRRWLLILRQPFSLGINCTLHVDHKFCSYEDILKKEFKYLDLNIFFTQYLKDPSIYRTGGTKENNEKYHIYSFPITNPYFNHWVISRSKRFHSCTAMYTYIQTHTHIELQGEDVFKGKVENKIPFAFFPKR